MRITLNKKKVATGILVLCVVIPSVALCEGNARQDGLQGAAGGSNIDTVIIKTDNTINGKVIAKENSHVIVGDVNISNTEAEIVDVYAENKTKAITAKDNSTVAIGSTNISNLTAEKVDIDTINTVTGKIKATDHSSATVGNVNIH